MKHPEIERDRSFAGVVLVLLTVAAWGIFWGLLEAACALVEVLQ